MSLAVVVVVSFCGAATARPDRGGSRVTMVCSTTQRHLLVHHGRYVLRTPSWRGHGPVCLRNHDDGPNYRVTRVPRPGSGGFVETFPSILYGCYWGVCSRHNKLPMEVRDIRALHSTLQVRTLSNAEGDASFDIWFGHRPHARGEGHINGAELMIFLRHFGGCCAMRDPLHVSAGKYHYDLMHWTAFDPKTRAHPYRDWTYIQFRMTKQTNSVHRLDLLAIIKIAERNHLIRPNWYLENVEAGFEVWHGGTRCPNGQHRPDCGLAIKNFSVSVHGTPASGPRPRTSSSS